MKDLFEGHKNLFEGLWIENQWDWSEQYPVIHISFNSIGYKELGLVKALKIQLMDIAKASDIVLEKTGISQLFQELLLKLSQKNKVVLLIDEYDKPIIDYLHDIPKAKANQQILKSFYSIIKDSDPYIRFLMITGVSKFSKVSIFSELNNLNDLTTHPKYTTLVGYTQEELEQYFEEGINELTGVLAPTSAALLQLIREWYNGYSWDGKNFVYNPFSILCFFDAGQFKNFWFATGTPTFLIKLLKDRQLVNLEEVEVDESAFESYDVDNLDTFPLLFQTGYSTVKEIKEHGIYLLDYPNKEVKESMLRHLIGKFRNDSPALTAPLVVRLWRAFAADDLEQVITIVNGLFKSIPSQIFIKDKEAYYHSVVFLVFQYLGQFVESEVNTSDGRIDAVVHTDTHLYILEFKLDETAQAALRQIREKGYADKYLPSDKEVKAIGINFSSDTKKVEDWGVEVYH